MIEIASARPFLLDVSRLVWRIWRGNLPTGIDRVCQAYVKHFRSRSQAVVQRKGLYFVLSPSDSDRLFDALVSNRGRQRFNLLKLAAAAFPRAVRAKPKTGSIYLNVGHTGLDEVSLPEWIRRNQLRAVYLIHDLIPLTHPEYCRPGEVQKHARRMGNVLASASGVIGNSQATLDDLRSFATRNGQRLPAEIVAWIGGGEFPRPASPTQFSKPHFVTVGTIEGRKNHLLLLDVWRRLVAELGENAPALLIVGQRGWQADRVIKQLDDLGELNGHVREMNRCEDAELAALINGARALLMPSYAEGFGLPVFEALELGTPVIASDLPVYREIGGDIPLYLDPDDVEGWSAAIMASCQNNHSAHRASGAGLRAPTWQDHFRKIDAWLATLARASF